MADGGGAFCLLYCCALSAAGIFMLTMGHIHLSGGGEDAVCKCVEAKWVIKTRRSEDSTWECKAHVRVRLVREGAKHPEGKFLYSNAISSPGGTLPDGCGCEEETSDVDQPEFDCYWAPSTGGAYSSKGYYLMVSILLLVVGYCLAIIACGALCTIAVAVYKAKF